MYKGFSIRQHRYGPNTVICITCPEGNARTFTQLEQLAKIHFAAKPDTFYIPWKPMKDTCGVDGNLVIGSGFGLEPFYLQGPQRDFLVSIYEASVDEMYDAASR